MGPNPARLLSLQEKERHSRRCTQREDQVITKTGVMCLRAKECQGLPETAEANRRAWDKRCPGGFRESMVLVTLGVGTSYLQTCKGAHFCCIKASHVMVLCYGGWLANA